MGNAEITVDTIVERYILALLYYSLSGKAWIDDLRFLSSYSVCEWPDADLLNRNGVECNKERYVKSIKIVNNNINGTLPRELLYLKDLEKLWIDSEPNLHGTLPKEFGEMKNLDYLRLFQTSVGGTLPESLSALTQLRTLNLYGNRFDGAFPSFKNWERMSYIKLSSNAFNGTIPPLKIQSELEYISVSNNAIRGTLPKEFYSQSKLKKVYLYNNKLAGTISQSIQGLSNLEYLVMYNNDFHGQIPTSLSKLKHLKKLEINENRFSGAIPSDLGKMKRLIWANFSHNQFVGNIPSELGNMVDIESLSFASNQNITGNLPSHVGQLKELIELDIEDTGITGGIEEAFCKNSNLLTNIAADCGTTNNTNPKVECSCCSKCCGVNPPVDLTENKTSTTTSTCRVVMNRVCETKLQYTLKYDSVDADASCACSEDGTRLRCSDVACKSCSFNGNVCAKNSDYGYNFNRASGAAESFQSTLQYHNVDIMGDDNTTLNITYSKNSALGRNCNVFVEGQKCRSCTFVNCASNFQGPSIECDNVKIKQFGSTGFNFDPCSDGVGDAGFLDIFYLYDKSRLNGCPLKLRRSYT